MRRKEREITDNAKINEIIDKCSICRLGLNDNGRIYIIPLNFGFCTEAGKRVLYFHGTNEGRKIDLVNQTHYAAFEFDINYNLCEGDKACSYTAEFESVVGEGKIEIIENSDQKRKALSEIMYHNTRRKYWDFPDSAIQNVGVLRLEVEELSCKAHYHD